jgi:hypothetical protein
MIAKKQFRYLYRHDLFNRQLQDESAAKRRDCLGSFDWRFIAKPIDCVWKIEVETALLLHEPLPVVRARLESLYQQWGKNQHGIDEVFQRSTRQQIEAYRQLRLWRQEWSKRHGKAGE